MEHGADGTWDGPRKVGGEQKLLPIAAVGQGADRYAHLVAWRPTVQGEAGLVHSTHFRARLAALDWNPLGHPNKKGDRTGTPAVAVDAEGRLLSVNRAGAELLGIRPEAVGLPLAASCRQTALLDCLERARNSDATDVLPPVELRLWRGGGELRAQARVAPLPDAGDGRRGWVVVLEDVTRMRRLETIRRDFVANVSHELRTPATAVQGYLETALADGTLADETRRFLEIALRHVRQMGRIIADLLALADVECEDRRVPLERQPLAPVLESAAQSLGGGAAERNVTVVVDCPATLEAMMNARLVE